MEVFENIGYADPHTLGSLDWMWPWQSSVHDSF